MILQAIVSLLSVLPKTVITNGVHCQPMYSQGEAQATRRPHYSTKMTCLYQVRWLT